MPRRESKVQVRITTDLRLRLDKLLSKTGVSEPLLVTRCLEACCDHVERAGTITFPFVLQSGKDRSSQDDPFSTPPATKRRGGTLLKAKRVRLRDIQEISLPIFGTIPAGWTSENQSMEPQRKVKVPKGKYPSGAFGLVVKGNSMNAALGKLGPICDGDIVVLVPFESAIKAKGKIVAALSDGGTTLKRFEGVRGGRPVLTSETKDPFATRKIIPEYDLSIQGVVIDKLNR